MWLYKAMVTICKLWYIMHPIYDVHPAAVNSDYSEGLLTLNVNVLLLYTNSIYIYETNRSF